MYQKQPIKSYNVMVCGRNGDFQTCSVARALDVAESKIWSFCMSFSNEFGIFSVNKYGPKT